MTFDDLDAFPEVDRRDAAAAAIEAERQRMLPQQQLGFDGSERAVGDDPEPSVRTHLRALVYESRSGGPPHVVSLHDVWDSDARAYVKAALCICDATRNLHRRPEGCWAMVDARSLFGLAPIGGT